MNSNKLLALLCCASLMLTAASQPAKKRLINSAEEALTMFYQPGQALQIEGWISMGIGSELDTSVLALTTFSIDTTHYVVSQAGESQIRVGDTLLLLNHELRQITLITGANNQFPNPFNVANLIGGGHSNRKLKAKAMAGEQLPPGFDQGIELESVDAIPGTTNPRQQAQVLLTQGGAVAKIVQQSAEGVPVEQEVYDALPAADRLLIAEGADTQFLAIRRTMVDVTLKPVEPAALRSLLNLNHILEIRPDGTVAPANRFHNYTLVQF